MSDAPSGRKKGRHADHEEHEEHVNHEAWVIPYADVLTLLMALFLVMWALGDSNEEKTNIAAESFRRELGGRGGIADFDIGFGTGGGPLANGGVSVLEGAGPAPLSSDVDPNSLGFEAGEEGDGDNGFDMEPMEGVLVGVPPEDITPADPYFDPLDSPELSAGNGDGDDEDTADGDAEDGGAAEGAEGSGGAPLGSEADDPLDVIEQAVREEATGSGLNNSIGFRREERGLVVSIVSDQVLFGEGDDAVQGDGAVILDVIADALSDTSNAIIIEGHTDSRPINTAEFPSNWELSTARATSVLRFLTEDLGLPAGRFSAAGYADTRPIDEGTSAEALARNRRVEIVVIG